jgi:hypothetical protein
MPSMALVARSARAGSGSLRSVGGEAAEQLVGFGLDRRLGHQRVFAHQPTRQLHRVGQGVGQAQLVAGQPPTGNQADGDQW